MRRTTARSCSLRVRSKRGRQPSRVNAQPGTAICKKPPSSTPPQNQFILTVSVSPRQEPATSRPIIETLSQIGESAGSRKRFSVCNAALNAAARHTKTRYGNNTTASFAASNQRPMVASSAPNSCPSPAIQPCWLNPAIATSTSTLETTASQLDTWLTKVKAPARWRCSSSSLSVGTNAAVMPPSASNLRKRFGSWKAVA